MTAMMTTAGRRIFVDSNEAKTEQAIGACCDDSAWDVCIVDSTELSVEEIRYRHSHL